MRFFLGLIALFLVPGSVLALWDALLVIAYDKDLWIPLVCGLAVGFPVYFTVIRKIPYLSTFEHELTHAIVALLFFRRIRKFIVTARRGGEVQYSGNFGGAFGELLIGLAPYYLPTFTLILALLRPVFPAAWFPWYDGLIGATLAFHICSTPEETKEAWTKRTFTGAGGNQKIKTDIGKVGYIFALLVIAGFGIFLIGLVLQLIGTGYPGTWAFLKQVGVTSYETYAEWSREIYGYLAPVIRQWF